MDMRITSASVMEMYIPNIYIYIYIYIYIFPSLVKLISLSDFKKQNNYSDKSRKKVTYDPQ